MSLATIDIFHVLAAISALLVMAHLGGFLAARAGLPPMIGELLGGLLLGATVLRRVWPDGSEWLIPATPGVGEAMPAVLPVLGFCSQLGLLLLMFIGGLQMRRLVTRADAKAVGWISSLGVAVPVICGLLLLLVIDVTPYMGTAQNETALDIILLAALAVTSIPVITRIFIDLGLMETRLARIVLSVAVIEDVLLYIAVSIAIGMAEADAKSDASIPHYLGLEPDSPLFIAWHVGASLALLAFAAWGFGKAGGGSRTAQLARTNPVARRSTLGYTVAAILGITLLAMLLGLAPMFGALVAGIAASRATSMRWIDAQRQIESVGLAFFIPLYFALIGVSLDLVNAFDWKFTVGILIVGTLLKYVGSLVGARIAGEPSAMANALAISVNARGGPGLVLASTAFAAGIINESAYTGLVILALATSVGAGVFLANVLRSNPSTTKLIRGEDPAATDTDTRELEPA
ncbi:MAG: sodium:proton antiporter [Thermoleophilia bacterium]|nr:sodium:proton antiporter [Thermoleophilia bacterium]MCZ4495865.1 sodium:proton antiporter [Thermoleophilia bacterium]